MNSYETNQSFDACSQSTLHSACTDGDMGAVCDLILQRADVNIQDERGNEPLKYAILGGYSNVIECLHHAGATLSLESTIDLECKFCQSAALGNITHLKLLLEGRVSINSVDYDRRSALHLAASHGQIETVSFLLESGVDCTYQDRWGRNALDYAAQSGNDALQNELRLHGLMPSLNPTFQAEKRAKPSSPPRWASMGNIRQEPDRQSGPEHPMLRWKTCSDIKGLTAQHQRSGEGLWPASQAPACQNSALSARKRRNSCASFAASELEAAVLLALSRSAPQHPSPACTALAGRCGGVSAASSSGAAEGLL